MNSKNLRVGAGGNPAPGPHPDLANPMPRPTAGEDFPDPPHEQPVERPQDQPDLDAFAARMGTDRLEDRSSPEGTTPQEDNTSGEDDASRADDSTREDNTSVEDDTSREDSTDDSTRDWRTPVAAALGGLASGARTASERLKGVSEKLVAGDEDSELDRTDVRQRAAKVRTVIVPDKLRQLIDVARARVGADRSEPSQSGTTET